MNFAFIWLDFFFFLTEDFYPSCKFFKINLLQIQCKTIWIWNAFSNLFRCFFYRIACFWGFSIFYFEMFYFWIKGCRFWRCGVQHQLIKTFYHILLDIELNVLLLPTANTCIHSFAAKLIRQENITPNFFKHLAWLTAFDLLTDERIILILNAKCVAWYFYILRLSF